MEGVFYLCFMILSGGVLWERASSAKISCKTCKEFVTNFGERLEATSTSNYAGGDTSWEEENLGLYSDSEVRLVEILDTVCSRSDHKCNSLLEEAEEDIERWWFKLRKKREMEDLKTWLCFNHLDVCCPENTFGPSCQACPGRLDSTCGGRGKCEGAEEKDGKGKCVCDEGYTGDVCQSCNAKFFREEGDIETTIPTQLECKACDKSCNQSCDGPGAGDCDSCVEGYRESDDGVCEDFDECKSDGDTRCKDGTYCFNTPGSFRCNDCDKSCKKICSGPGPSKCAECASGYTRNEHGVCRDNDECSADGSAKCNEGTYCENTPGKYVCKACHVACLSGCYGPGVKSCIECKEGYIMSNEEGCIDTDECAPGDSTHPCDLETEVCHNLVGTYVCKCRDDLVKGEDGKCVQEEVRDDQRREKRKKKKKKKKKKVNKVDLDKVRGEDENTPLETHDNDDTIGGSVVEDGGVGVVVEGGVVNDGGGVSVIDDGDVVNSAGVGVVSDGGENYDTLTMMDTLEGGVGGVVSEMSPEQESHDEL